MTRTERKKQRRQAVFDGTREVCVYLAAWSGVSVRRFTFVYSTTGKAEGFFIEYWPELLISAASALGVVSGLDAARGIAKTEAQKAARRAQWGPRVLAAFLAAAGTDGLLGDI